MADAVERTPRDLCASVRDFIDDLPVGRITLDEIAGHFFVSKYHLCRAFKAAYGVTVHTYILSRRVAEAEKLIAAGVTASDAAYRVGFGDYSAFYRAFVNLRGTPPSGVHRFSD